MIDCQGSYFPTINGIDILLKNRSIPLPLHVSETHINVDFLFCECIMIR